MKRLVFLSFAMAIAMASCLRYEPNGSLPGPDSEQGLFRIECNMENFKQDVATKVTTTLSGESLSSVWNEGDVIGVFPDMGGDQVTFTVTGGAGTCTCLFDGDGWGLMPNARYSGYYPFHTDNYGDTDARKHIGISYVGQQQSVKDVYSVGKYDYMVCTNAVPSFADADDPGTCTFNFKHLGALLVLDITFPEAATLDSLEMVAGDNLFIQTGTVDLSQYQAFATIAPASVGNTLALALSGMPVSAGETIRFYMMAPPSCLSEASAIKAVLSNGRKMTTQLSNAYELIGGHAYAIAASLVMQPAVLELSQTHFYPSFRSTDITFRVTSDEQYTVAPTVGWLTQVSETAINPMVKEYTFRTTANRSTSQRAGAIRVTGATSGPIYVNVYQSGLSVPVAGEGRTIYNTTGNYKYRYGPSIIMHDNGTIDAWFASPGNLGTRSGMADVLTYRCSTDGGQTWSSEVLALEGTYGTNDAWSICDPGAAYFDGYYYMAYTSTTNTSSSNGLQGLENDCYIARSTSPTGPWQKWSGSGWGNNPQPIIEYTGPSGKWGVGEPSIVVKDNTIYIYYTYDDGNSPLTKVATADRSNPNWPGSLTLHGTAVDKSWLAITHDGIDPSNPALAPLLGSYDSCDVKYVEDHGLFYAFHTSWRITALSRLSVWTSVDGLTFTYLGDVTGNVIIYAHNMGVSGDGLGHIDLSKTQYVSYAYSPANVSDRAHGQWSTYWSVLTYEAPLPVVPDPDPGNDNGNNNTPDITTGDSDNPMPWGSGNDN